MDLTHSLKHKKLGSPLHYKIESQLSFAAERGKRLHHCIEIRVTVQTHSLAIDVYVMLQILYASFAMRSIRQFRWLLVKTCLTVSACQQFGVIL